MFCLRPVVVVMLLSLWFGFGVGLRCLLVMEKHIVDVPCVDSMLVWSGWVMQWWLVRWSETIFTDFTALMTVACI